MTRIFSILVVVMLVMVAIVFGAKKHGESTAPTADGAGPAAQWEYLVVQGGTVNLSPSGSETMRKERDGFVRESFVLEQNMDKLGAKGWELVQASGSPSDPVLYFKRRK